MNRTASIVAGIYCAITVSFAVRAELEKGEGWSGTALRHMYTFVATAPISFPLSAMGMEPNFDRHWVVALIILGVTAMVYGVVAGIGWIVGRF
jgi:hypothetical protein